MYLFGKLIIDIVYEINILVYFLNINLKFLSDVFNNINSWLDCVFSGICMWIWNIENKVEWEFLKEEIFFVFEEVIYGIEIIGWII